VDLPYEAPEKPELRLETEAGDPADTAKGLLEAILERV
jgi:adenylylsulfate kinase-like enzyme